MGAAVEPIKISINTPLDCKKTLFSNIKIHSILDAIGYVLYHIIHLQKFGRGAALICGIYYLYFSFLIHSVSLYPLLQILLLSSRGLAVMNSTKTNVVLGSRPTAGHW